MNIENTISDLKNGSTKALRELHKQYSKKLFYFVYAYTHNTQVSEELVQDVFIKLWNNKESLKISSSINSYIYTIAKNLTIDFMRKKKNNIIPIDSVNENEFANRNDGETEIISLEEIAFLNRAIEKLSPRKKEVFKMQRFEKKTYKSIAEELKISVSAVEKNMSSALTELRYNISKKNYS